MVCGRVMYRYDCTLSTCVICFACCASLHLLTYMSVKVFSKCFSLTSVRFVC